MGYDLAPRNEELDEFHFGAFSWPIVLEACGYLFASVQKGGQYEFVPGVDERMPEGDTYPRIVTNDGFPVTDEEARIMARCARNFVALRKDDVREDFLERFSAFADWAEKSGGFEIW